MKIVAAKDNICDWCGRTPIKVHRRYKGEVYCVSCYANWFVKKGCSICGNIHRLHKKENNPVCSDCRRRQLCIRCGGDAFRDGANTVYGRVCKSCYSYHFKSRNACYECGKLKPNLTKSKYASHDQPICSSCSCRYTHETCPRCRRYRILLNTQNGKVCKLCASLGNVICKSCGQLTPAGVGSLCWNCYWQQKIKHEIKITSFLFKSDLIKKAYQKFIDWLISQKGVNKAALKHIKFVDFFVRCDELWQCIPEYRVLVAEFKPNGLRKYLTVIRWLININRITECQVLKQQIAEEERILKLLNKFADGVPDLILSYYQMMRERFEIGKIALKSVRLALQPAIDICIRFNVEYACQLEQTCLNQYLVSRPGQYSAISGFINHLNKKFESNLICSKAIDKKEKRGKLEKEIIKLMQNHAFLKSKGELYWLKLGMLYFHNVKISNKKLKQLSFEIKNTMVVLYYEKYEYTLPMPFGTIAL